MLLSHSIFLGISHASPKPPDPELGKCNFSENSNLHSETFLIHTFETNSEVPNHPQTSTGLPSIDIPAPEHSDRELKIFDFRNFRGCNFFRGSGWPTFRSILLKPSRIWTLQCLPETNPERQRRPRCGRIPSGAPNSISNNYDARYIQKSYRDWR